MTRFRVSASEMLDRRFDVEERLARIPSRHAIKGVFLIPFVRALGREDYARLARDLLAPPRLAYYVPFADYPERDCARLAFAAARKLHPDVPLSEGCRRVGRRDVENFANTTLGRVMLGHVRNPASCLLEMPDVYKLVLSDVQCRTELLDDGAVRLEYENLHGTLDNLQIGTVEGVVLAYGGAPRIEVELHDEGAGTFVVRW